MESLRVELGERSYPIHIGSGLLSARELYAPHLGGVAVVTNAVVAPLYLAQVKKAMGDTADIIVPDGEEAKSWRGVEQVVDGLLAARLGRDGLVVALGGGVIGDLAGFAAAVYQRGVPFVQVPTTLLAQVDSSVGGKTAVNHPGGKNLIGAFHQPRLVWIDVGSLKTLPRRQVQVGMAEIIKHAVILGPSLFELLEDKLEAVMALEGTTQIETLSPRRVKTSRAACRAMVASAACRLPQCLWGMPERLRMKTSHSGIKPSDMAGTLSHSAAWGWRAVRLAA